MDRDRQIETHRQDHQILSETSGNYIQARIRGLKDTLWEDGCFHLKIRYSEHYDVQPPEVCFHTIPFHPNINPVTGEQV